MRRQQLALGGHVLRPLLHQPGVRTDPRDAHAGAAQAVDEGQPLHVAGVEAPLSAGAASTASASAESMYSVTAAMRPSRISITQPQWLSWRRPARVASSPRDSTTSPSPSRPRDYGASTIFQYESLRTTRPSRNW